MSHLEHLTEAIRQGAADIVRAVAPLDVRRLVILDEHRDGFDGTSTGSGHMLAQAHAHAGATAVRVKVPRLVASIVDEFGIVAASTRAARQLVEAVTLHELAHALVSPLDALVSDYEARAAIAASDALPITSDETNHHPRWAAVLVTLTNRVIDLRPECEREHRRAFAVAELRCRGLDFDTIERVIGQVPDHLRLRDVFAPGSPASLEVEDVCPSVDARRRLINSTTGRSGGLDPAAVAA